MVTRVMMMAAAMRTVWLFSAAAKLRSMALRLRRASTKRDLAFHLSGGATRGAVGSAAAAAYQLRGSGSIKMVRSAISLTRTPKMR